jgi:protein-S-isoprenylcysteine O-methyltransferase Ste14
MTHSPPSPALDKRQLFDVIVRIALALVFALFTGFYFRNAINLLRALDPAHPGAGIVHALSILAIGLYTFMLSCAYALRLKPRNKFAGVWPCTAAILGGFLVLALLLLEPRTDLSLPMQILGSALVMIGDGLAFVILTRLGRSFSILPESRRLVTTGPYSIVRHPLYVAEALATLGVLINFLSLAAFFIVAVQFALQLVRIYYEERVLQESFPEYADYARRTARLIPGVY